MRAIQVLPGVTTGDDFRSEFAVRGSDSNRVNFTFDGIPSTFLLHTVQQEQDGGSVAMVNGDILGGITLLNGSVPSVRRSPGRRAGLPNARGIARSHAAARWRERHRFFARHRGPDRTPQSRRVVFSVRKSYLDMLLDQISDDNDFGFGFTDVQSKLVYDVSSRHRLELSLVAGRSRLDRTVDAGDVNETKDGKNAAELASLAWRFTATPSVVLTQRLALAPNDSRTRTSREPSSAVEAAAT